MKRCFERVRQRKRSGLCILFLIFYLLFSAACSSTTPEQQAAHAAQKYYKCLAEGYVEGFLEGKAGVGDLPSAYCEQLLQAYKMYIADMQRKHKGLREVRISPNVGRCDSTLHLTHAFLLLCYADSTQEEITVPMVESDGEWRMK